jgi:hypothetical protein
MVMMQKVCDEDKKADHDWKCVEDGAMVAHGCGCGYGYTWFAECWQRDAVIVAHG